VHKKVILELEIEADFESSVYAALGDLLAEVEDGNFTVKSVKVDDVPTITLGAIPKIDGQAVLRDVARRSSYKSSY
jgi:hypothetical protein